MIALSRCGERSFSAFPLRNATAWSRLSHSVMAMCFGASPPNATTFPLTVRKLRPPAAFCAFVTSGPKTFRAACQRRFVAANHAQFITNDGRSLETAKDQAFDLIFSFDLLVHAEYDILAAYIPQIVHKLSSVGVAFIHHSNLLAYNNTIGQPHGRALTVSADAVADLIYRAGGTVLI